MAVKEVQQFACTIPPGTAEANPAVFPVALMNLTIEWIEWEVPPGTRGEVGFWIGSHGQQILPFTAAGPNPIVTDGRATHWDVEDLPTSGDWEVRGFNVGVNPHTITVRFGLGAPVDTAGAGVTLMPNAVLSSSVPGA